MIPFLLRFLYQASASHGLRNMTVTTERTTIPYSAFSSYFSLSCVFEGMDGWIAYMDDDIAEYSTVKHDGSAEEAMIFLFPCYGMG